MNRKLAIRIFSINQFVAGLMLGISYVLQGLSGNLLPQMSNTPLLSMTVCFLFLAMILQSLRHDEQNERLSKEIARLDSLIEDQREQHNG